MSHLLEGRLVVVTGGAGLLGRTFCRAIAAHGGKVIIADRQLDAAKDVATDIQKDHPGAAAAAAVDITERASIEALIQHTHDTHGRIDAVVNNAYPRNAHYGRALDEVTYEDFCDNVGLHLGGYFLVMQRFANYFRTQGAGNIVNMSSIYGVMAPRFSVYEGTPMTMPVEYAAIKAGVGHLTRYFAQYLKGTGIRVNTLSPGGILDRQPQPFLDAYQSHCAGKGMLSPGDLSGSLVFLLSDLSRHVDGQNLVVDDGFSI
jgi:NAD(P)-dependent dehydrogenase (short-subunit alcohol dehydrogenase family)